MTKTKKRSTRKPMSKESCKSKITVSSTIDPVFKEIYDEYIDDIIKNESLSNRANLARSMAWTITYLFKDCSLKDFTASYLSEKMKTQDYNKLHLRRIWTLLKMLKDRGLLFDKKLQYICSGELRNNIDRCISTDKMIRLLDENPKHLVFSPHTDSAYWCFINTVHEDIFEVIKEFLTTTNICRSKTFSLIFEHFDESLANFSISSINDLNWNTFLAQIHYFKSLGCGSKDISFLNSLYTIIGQKYNHSLFHENGLDIRIFTFKGIANLIADGYEILHYSKYETVPENDKILLYYADSMDTNAAVRASAIHQLDFTNVSNPVYRKWLKSYIWNGNGSLQYRFDQKSDITRFLNYIEDIKTGAIPTVYKANKNILRITTSEVAAFKNHVLVTLKNNRSQCNLIYSARNLINYLDINHLMKVPEGVYKTLTHTLYTSYNDSTPINDEDLNKLLSYLKTQSNYSVTDKLMYIITCILVETEFRSSQVVALETDCILETAKRNEYELYSKVKTNGSVKKKQAITLYTKQNLEECIAITNEFRKDCTVMDLKKYIFLVPDDKKRGLYKVISQGYYDSYISSICQSLNMTSYNSGNFRDAHATKAEEYIVKNSLSDMELTTLTGHSTATTDRKFYIQKEIRKLLESVNGIIIGNVDIDGKIIKKVPDHIKNNEHSVYHQCGFCTQESCHDFSYLECLTCKDFACDPSNLPFFRIEMKRIKTLIKARDTRHDKEDLVAILRLLTRYVEELMLLISNDERENIMKDGL